MFYIRVQKVKFDLIVNLDPQMLFTKQLLINCWKSIERLFLTRLRVHLGQRALVIIRQHELDEPLGQFNTKIGLQILLIF